MNLQQLQENCKLLNVRLFCEEYGIVYDSMVKVLREERPLTEKFAIKLSEAFRKFRFNIHL